VSDKGLLEICEHEGIVPTVYFDSVGVKTYGVGHTKAAGDPDPNLMPTYMPAGDALDEAVLKAIRVFGVDVEKYAARVNRAITVPLKQHQFDALVSFDFNTGGIFKAQLTKQINSGDKAYACTVIDADTIELNGILPVDEQGREWPAYTSGGFLDYATPVDMTGYTARMAIRNKVGGTLLASADVADAPLNIINITIDNAAKTILLEIQEPETAEITFKTAITDLEMVSPTGRVNKLKLTTTGSEEDPDPVIVMGEVTT